MLRRFNYTGRERIHREHVAIDLINTQPVREFTLRAALGEYKLPPHARVLVEAYENTVLMRFDFGTVTELNLPADRKLTDFEGSDAVRFRLKVVDTDQKKILAEADSIIPLLPGEQDERRQPLLPIRPADLGEQVWQLEFLEGSHDVPVLLINKQVPDAIALVRSPEFMALSLPAIFRELLTRILVYEDHADMDDDSDWKCLWLRFGRLLSHPPSDPPSTREDRPEWIDQAVGAFCRKLQVFTHYVGSKKGQS